MVERELTLSEEVLAEKYKDRLESSYRVIYFYLLSTSSLSCIIEWSAYVHFTFTGFVMCNP